MTAWNGFPPEGLTLYCRRCGTALSGDGGNRPAETYAGTYTGLCYACQRVGAFPLRTEALDGAVWWEWPPHCPSWRRDRQTFVGYPDCTECGGRGRELVSRAVGGSYPRNCRGCMDRLSNHPARKKARARRARLYEAANRVFQARVTAQTGPGFQALIHGTEEEVRRKAAKWALARYQAAVARWANP